MAPSRRDVLKHLGATALSLGAGIRARGATAQPGLPLEEPGFCVNLGLLAGADPSITAYSGYCYSPLVDALLLFGGGHAATAEDVVLRFPLSQLAWSADYTATPKSARIATNLTSGKFWHVDGEVPPFRPVARHTYTGNIWSHAIGRLIVMGGNNGVGYGEIPETTGGNMAEYDPITRTWEDTGVPGAPWYYIYAEDPVSGHILAITDEGLRVYDPRARAWLQPTPVGGRIPFVQGGENLVYYPPTDRFYYFGLNANATQNGPPTIEFAFDRTALRPVFSGATISPMITNWRPRASLSGAGTGYAYDAANQLIVGQMLNGLMYGFRPLGGGVGQWLQHPIATTTETSSYCHAYVPTINAHLVTCVVQTVGKCTFAFRWNPALAVPAADPRLPASVITARGSAVATLQAACDVGGEITLSSGGLYGAAGCAIINKSVHIVGDGTVLEAPGISGKGILIVNADARLANLDISGATVPDGNGAGIRHQDGNLYLENIKLHGCQDGLLAGQSAGSILMTECDVYDNGTGTGTTHGVYVGKISQFICANSRFWDTSIGHHIKTRAAVSVIQGCEVGMDFVGTESYNVDIPVGGDVILSDCHLRQGPSTDNYVMVNYGSEPDPYPGGSLRVSNCVFESSDPRGIGIRNALPDVVAIVEDCHFVGTATPTQGNCVLVRCTLNGIPLPDGVVTNVEIRPADPDFDWPGRGVGPHS